MTDRTYRVYMIKCKPTNEVYIGRTDSVNEKYNPISVLYKRYKQDKTKYTKLGEAIEKNKFTSFVFNFMKEGLSDSESNELVESAREKVLSRSLHDPPVDNGELFKDEELLFM